MQKITCEACGSTEIVKNGDFFVCQFCGCKYTIQEVKNIINNNNVVINNIQANTVNILQGDFNNLMAVGKDSWDNGDFKTAYNHFMKASEIVPNNKECLIYKALCVGWLSESNNIKLSTTISAYEKFFLKEQFENTNEVEKYASLLNNLLVGILDMLIDMYDPDYPDSSLVYYINDNCWTVCSGFDVIDSIIEKYNLDIAQHYTEYENYRASLAFLCRDKVYNTHFTGGMVDIKHVTIDESSEVEKRIGEIDSLLKDINPSYEPPKTKSGGCYIATCVYGSYDCPEVWTLRRYRDTTLAATWYGRFFIHLYYAVSPTLVKLFGKTKWFNNICRPKLDRFVQKLKKQGFENTPYQDIDWQNK